MTLPQALAAVVDLQHAHRELLRVVDSLKPADWERGVPYGEWTVKDLVSHCIGDMSPSGPGLIAAGVLTPQFIAETSETFDVRARNQAMVEERRRYTPEDLRQLLFEAHDAKIEATLRLDEAHLPVLDYDVPMGEDYDIKVLDWLWYGYHDRQHADDLRRALEIEWSPVELHFAPEIEEYMRQLVRSQDGLLRAIYSVADDAWAQESQADPGWTYHDIVAHLSSNEARRRTRLLSALGEAKPEQLAAINDVDEWNSAAVAERREWPLRRLVDELVLGWHQIQQLLTRFRAEHLSAPVTLGGGQTIPVSEFLTRMSSHTSRHAGQLVPASRARRT
ncbi:MAG TPA: maleylpyruvate isomerase N-terminal domain-containing protein [Dehalococcoidia bacterium]|nr:maleylpyruvate isomerase N-terminal domain-containing protein [Dehalococcoidia bacterium]